MTEIAWDEVVDAPCMLALRAFGSDKYDEFQNFGCPNSYTGIFAGGIHRVSLSTAIIGRIEVCNNDNIRTRLKGIRIWGDTINPDG